MKLVLLVSSCVLFTVFSQTVTLFAQTTQIIYQGSFKNGALPGSGNYDFEFLLFDALSGGTQLGTTNSRNSVPVTDGIFSVQLDFGDQFPGSNRFLEIRLRPTGGGGLTLLSPRQPVNSSPYAIRALSSATAANATQLGGVAANQFVLTGDPRLSNARDPLPGSANYIQNQNAASQASSNFSISGMGKAASFDANSFSINGVQAIRSANIDSVYFGNFSGTGSTTGNSNSFVGGFSGMAGTSGAGNSYFGAAAGQNTSTGNYNTFIGLQAGAANITGDFNTAIGAAANVTATGVVFATAIGSYASASSSDTVVIGKLAGTYDNIVRPADAVQMPGALTVAGILRVNSLGAAGTPTLCRNASNQISTCSSSIRYKSNVIPFSRGLDLIRHLRPVEFRWKETGIYDIGLVAEDVSKAETLLSTLNDKGEIEGVKYHLIGVVLVNAVNEQQVQIEEQQKQLGHLQNEIKELKTLICSLRPRKALCKLTGK